jgi:indolepyruvate ferredoxin oxidoreductase beta subunit
MEDLNATIGETYGISQRGGSVMSHIRMTAGTPVGPLIPRGEGDVLVGFEPMETLQVAMEFGNPQIRVILNPRPVYPIGVLSGDLTYPPIERILDLLQHHVADLKTLRATDIAKEAGEIRAMNVVMVGALAATGLLPMKKESYLKAIRDQFHGRALEINQRAFEKGYEASPFAQA